MLEFTEESINSFMDIAEELLPGFKEKAVALLNKKIKEQKEKSNAELLQKEQNMTAEINDLEYDLNAANDDVKYLSSSLQAAVDKQKEIKTKLENLKAEREEIHKKWIAVNPAESTQQRVKSDDEDLHDFRNDVKAAFNVIARSMGATAAGNCAWKRFDNLVHARCKTCSMFGATWTIDDVIAALKIACEYSLIESVKTVWQTCMKNK